MRVLYLTIAFLTALALSWQAHADPVRPFRATWVVFDSDCTDLYDTPVPAGGAVDLTAVANWDTFPEAYPLQDNLSARVQTSGSPDGLCDDSPATVLGTWTIGADTDLYLGPLKMPAAGGYLLTDFVTVGGTDWQFDVILASPFAPTTATELWRSGAQTTLLPALFALGPVPVTSSQVSVTEEFPWVTDAVYLRLDLDGAGTFTLDAALLPYRSDAHGRD
jgi:hypothetical protein